MSRLNRCLKGIRVLDLSRYLPGPLATLLLADLGAEVLKIEAPDGDPMQDLGPRDSSGRPIFYESINAGKLVRRMDLKKPEARANFLHLVKQADVLLESFRPGVMARLGLDYLVLSAANPRLVYCALSGYGAHGPRANEAGHDANYLALMGVLHRNGNSPNYFDPPIADSSGGLFAVIAILSALRARERDGRGCEIDLSLADSVAPLQNFQVADYGARGYSPEPNETYLNGGAAFYRVYRTKDNRHVVLGAADPKFWQQFCDAARRPDWTERFNDALPQHSMITALDELFGSLTLAECVERFGPADCCLTPVLTIAEALESENCRQRQLVRRTSSGELQALFPAWVDGEPPSERRPLQSTTGGFKS